MSSTPYFLLQGQVAPTLTFTIMVGATPLWISTPCYCHFIGRASGPTLLLYNAPPPLSFFTHLVLQISNHPHPPPIIIFIVGLVAPTSLSAIWCRSPPHPLQSFLYTLGFTKKYPPPPPPISILIVKLVAPTSRVCGPSFIFTEIVSTTPLWISKC